MNDAEIDTWSAALGPIAEKLELVARMEGSEAVWSKAGCQSLFNLLSNMEHLVLEVSVEAVEARNKGIKRLGELGYEVDFQPFTELTQRDWKLELEPHLRKLELGAKIDAYEASWAGESAKSFGRLVRDLAHELDVVAMAAIGERDQVVEMLEEQISNNQAGARL